MQKNRRLFKDKMAIVGLVIIIVLVLIAIFAPYIAPHNPQKIDLDQRLKSPSNTYPMGTDHLGRCIFSRVIYGARLSLSISFIVLLITLTVGVFIGVLSGYIGGFIDNLIMRLIDILLAFPGLILALAIAGMLGPSIMNIMIALSAVQWVGYARITRGMVLSIKEKEYVRAAKTCGASNIVIILRHILPNIISPIIVYATLNIGSVILRISGLSFLGVGAQPPTAEWGIMLNEGRLYMRTAPWVMIFPGISIMLVVIGFNLFGDGLRDVCDPK